MVYQIVFFSFATQNLSNTVSSSRHLSAQLINRPFKDSIFETYTLQSQADNNTVNLEVPLAPLVRALRSASPTSSLASNACSHSASIRLTKKDDQPTLCVTLIVKTPVRSTLPAEGLDSSSSEPIGYDGANLPVFSNERETHISQDVPIRVISGDRVSGLHEPRCREPDVHILLPPLAQIKGISDRFTRLASAAGGDAAIAGKKLPRLELSANMFGRLRLSLRTDSMQIQSEWSGLTNPELDPNAVQGGQQGLRDHPSTRMRERGDHEDAGWAVVRVDIKDWGRVMSAGRMGGRVVACT